jgi:hypothetical protein
LGTWHKKRKKKHKKKSWKKKNIIKSSADPWNLYVILHFFWLYLKEKKTKSSAILVANWLFSLLHHVYVQFLQIFFLILPIPSSHSSLPFFLFLTRSIYCDPPTTHPKPPHLPNFDS